MAGSLRLMSDGTAVVVRPASRPPEIAEGTPLLRTQLFFAVRTPAAPGTYSLHCSFYHRQNLLQSRVVTARVTALPEPAEDALRSRVDYALSRRLDPEHLERLTEQRLSLMLNDDGAGTHGFRFVGQGDFTSDAVVSEGVLAKSIDVVRRALHTVCWGKPEPWESGKQLAYRYQDRVSKQQLADDLISLAIRGAKLYFDVGRTLAGGRDRRDQLVGLMRTPGAVQIALKQGANHVLPAALFYDHPIDTQKDHTLCPAFTAALAAAAPIAREQCLQGRCPHWGDETIVCPSGFWGYRHRLGLPLTVAEGADAPTEIPYRSVITLAMCVATDFEYAPHLAAVKAARDGLEMVLVEDRDEALRLLRERALQIIYFYCHGGYTQDGFPTLVIGKGGPPLAAENLIKIRWKTPRPLVLLNGCHTAALKPETMLDMVTAFVAESGAAGVIGTEITIFESLARPFAEECLGAFLGGIEIGEAVRLARLALLQKHRNPLGLVYIPYVSTGISLVHRHAPQFVIR